MVHHIKGFEAELELPFTIGAEREVLEHGEVEINLAGAGAHVSPGIAKREAVRGAERSWQSSTVRTLQLSDAKTETIGAPPFTLPRRSQSGRLDTGC